MAVVPGDESHHVRLKPPRRLVSLRAADARFALASGAGFLASRMGKISYPRALLSSLVLISALMALSVFLLRNPLTSIPRDAGSAWYRDFGGRRVPEIQDEDLFYHNIGHSVAAARAADIVILGPSFSAYAFESARLKEFGDAQHLKFYNMSFIGIRGGQFSRRIVERWNIRPRLWIINVDDQPINNQVQHFFSRSTEVSLGAALEPIRTMEFSRFHGFFSAVSRTLKWRLEDWLAERQAGHELPFGFYRNGETGDMDLSSNARYEAETGNPPLRPSRDPDCHASSEAIAIGREFVAALGGTAVLTLVPHSQYCPRQAQELADALGVDAIVPLPPLEGYSTVDAGGHLDRKSAVKFTDFVLSRLVETSAYQRTFPAPAAGNTAMPPVMQPGG